MFIKFVLKLKQKRKGKITKQLIDMSFRFEKFPISINQVMSGNSEQYKEWLSYAQRLIFDQYRRKYDKLYEGRLFAVLRLYQNDYKTRDVDNYLKIVFDAFKGTVVEDDEVFDIILIYKVKGKPYTSDIAEIQILDMEKPIILSELIPKNDYIWIREKNNKTTNKIITASGILGSGKKLKQSIDSMLEQKKKENEDFLKIYNHFKKKEVISKSKKKEFTEKRNIIAFCVLLLLRIQPGGDWEESYLKYRNYLIQQHLDGLEMSKNNFKQFYEDGYKTEMGW